jgi:hypothetical protein
MNTCLLLLDIGLPRFRVVTNAAPILFKSFYFIHIPVLQDVYYSCKGHSAQREELNGRSRVVF